MSETPLIPRKLLYGNPDKAQAKISPDGRHISYLAPVDNVLNVWVAPSNDPANAKPITTDSGRGIRMYGWAENSSHILYIQDIGGDEDWHVYSTNLETGDTLDLTPFEKVAAQMNHSSTDFPDELIIGINNRVPELHDLYRINVVTGESSFLYENPGLAGFVLDDAFNVRLAVQPRPDGGMNLLKQNEGEWALLFEISHEDVMNSDPLGLDKSGENLYLKSGVGRNTAALLKLNLASGESSVIAENELADAGGVMIHPTDKTVQGVSFNYERNEWTLFDDAVSADINHLATIANGEINIASRTDADDVWIVAFTMSDGPVRYYLYTRADKSATFLFTNRTELEGQPLAPMQSTVIAARDGLNMVSYFTLPLDSVGDDPTRPTAPLPLVLYVHGGPWARDVWGFHPIHQHLANRGYAVLSVNFRGSTGFGKAHTNAGMKQWGRKMHDDLIDACEWAIEAGIAQRDAIAIMGGSYGGYAALAGVTMTPDYFACGVDIVGPSNLNTLLSSIPAYWKPMFEQMALQVGDPRTEDGAQLLKERSPLTYADNIRRPLLIGQGANDPRVKQAESDQIVEAMQANKIPVTYALYPDEGHGFARPANNLSFFGVTEAFLASVLEGRYEPLGDDLAGSSITVPVGIEGVLGLAEAMAARDD